MSSPSWLPHRSTRFGNITRSTFRSRKKAVIRKSFVASTPSCAEPMHRAGVLDPHQLPVADRDLAELERLVGGESLRGRTGGAVTLAVGMAVIFTDALHRVGIAIEGFVKYWYHFAIMFEALFILTTIDAGTRIARFLLQEALGRVVPKFERTDWLPGALLTTFLVTAGWGILVQSGSISTIWPMFGIANQLLAVMALGLVTTLLINSGRAPLRSGDPGADAVRHSNDDDRRSTARRHPVSRHD